MIRTVKPEAANIRTNAGKVIATTPSVVTETVYQPPFQAIRKNAGKVATVEDPYANCVVLYLKGNGVNNGTTITDSSPFFPKTPSNNNVITSTADSKYGGSSLYFAGNNNSQLLYSDQSDWDFDNGNYTFEFWCKGLSTANSGGTPYIAVCGNASNVGAGQAGWIISATPSTTTFSLNASTGTGTWNVIAHVGGLGSSSSGWVHCAFVRSGNNSLLFINGNLISTIAFSSGTMPYSSLQFWVGRTSGGFFNLTGYIDSLRITKRVARYTASFNPETDTYMS